MTTSTLELVAALALCAPAGAAQEPAAAFPPSTALAEGLSPDALARLDALVQGFVDDDEIVGAELLVIRNGRTVLHEAYGLRDREAQVPMQTGSVFCVRSMTKPLIGAAILMLVDDERIALEDRVARHLPAFDVEGLREVTVLHLLTHTSGLPMSVIIGRDLRQLDGVQEVAALGAERGLDFPPGSSFQYSDQGADALTALIEVVSGAPAEDFVRARVLGPLGMHESRCVLEADDPLRARTCSAYAGSPGAWTRYWSPADPPLFPLFLGSQALYSTAEDYARFLELMRRKGRAGKERLLSARSVRKALDPGPHPMNGSTGFPALRMEYGLLMQLWTGEDEDGEREVVAFGHTGSDGTHAWALPGENAMVLYLTQSRGTTTGLRVEEALGELFLGAPFQPNQVAPPFEDYLGLYWEGEGDLYRAIVRDGEDLALEILGKAVVPLAYVGEDRWKLVPEPATVLAFERSETGEVTGYKIGEHQEFRFRPSPDLPSADALAARVAAVHRIDLLESLGPIRVKGGLSIEKVGVQGDYTTLLAWPDRFRHDDRVGAEHGRIAFDGEHFRYAATAGPVVEADAARAAELRLQTPHARFGDWSRQRGTMQVIQQLERNGRDTLLVRMGDTSAPASTLYVDAETGRVVREDGMTTLDNLGRVGQRVNFSDFRDVSGMLLPFRTEVEIANPFIGTIVTTVDAVELGVELPEGTFELQD